MADAVSADFPLLILRDELLTHIAVDTMEDVNIIFVYSHRLILKHFFKVILLLGNSKG